MKNHFKTIWQWIKAKIKRALIALGIIGISLAVGVPAVDNQINPYQETAQSFVIEKQGVKTEIKRNEPKVKFSKWDNEVSFSISKEMKNKNMARDLFSDKIKTEDSDKSFEVYPLENGFEMEVILKKKPKTNIVEFEIETGGLEFYYQPELTQEEIDEGNIRPENVVGSYAVYYSKTGQIIYKIDKSKYTIDELNAMVLSGKYEGRKNDKTNEIEYFELGTNYMAGKVGHIYRPKMCDSNNWCVWGEFNKDLQETGKLTNTLPVDFWENAKYPIRHASGLTFGYTTLGTTGVYDIIAELYGTTITSRTSGMHFNLSENANITKMSAGLSTNDFNAESIDLFFAVYREDSAGADSHALVASAESLNVSISIKAFQDINFASESLVADDYILAVLGNGADISVERNVGLWCDTSGAKRHYAEKTTGSGSYATRKAEDPWTETDDSINYTFSIYATYTASGGSTPAPEEINTSQVIGLNNK